MRLATTIALVAITTGIGAPLAKSSTGGGSTNVREIVFTKNLKTSKMMVNWYNEKARWALFTRHDHCWELPGKKQRAVCKYARASLKAHAARIERLTAILYPPPPPEYGMMNPICQSSCISCESGWNPMAYNSAGYWGLYQFAYSTWVSNGGDPAMYGKASASEQHRVAANITYDAWPNC